MIEKRCRCLACYQFLESQQGDFHHRCSMKIFGTPAPPEFPFNVKDIREQGKRIVIEKIAVTGVQPKLSLEIEKAHGAGERRRFTIAGLPGVFGDFILKPPTPKYSSVPENEDLVMHLASIAGLKTAVHTLYRMQSGELAYLTRRFDRERNHGKVTKLAIEDMCQLTERLTEHKYHGSLEQVGKAIRKYSDFPGLDAIAFFELNIFSFLIANSDMHLKNFSLLTRNGFTALAPGYDLLSTALLFDDAEETALTLNGKKANVSPKDWKVFAATLEINPKALENSYKRIRSCLPNINDFISQSFLEDTSKAKLRDLIRERSERVFSQS